MTTKKHTPKKFRAELFLAGKTATGFEVPAEIVEGLGSGKKPPVKVTINGYTYRNGIAVYGGVFMIGVSAEHRAGARVKAGQEINVSIELDTEPRIVEVPADFQKALDKNPVAKKKFESLSYSHKSQHVLAILGAKAEETRKRRIDKAIEMLKEVKI